MAARRLRRALPLLLLLAAALVREAVAADEPAPAPARRRRRPPPPADDSDTSPSPPRRRNRSPPPPEEVPAPPSQEASPPPQEASPPPQSPSPPPPAPSPPPPSPPPYPTLKLIMKITGAPFPLDDTQINAVISAVSAAAVPNGAYTYQFKTQTPSAPGVLPLPGARLELPTFVPLPPPPPEPEASPPPPDNENNAERNNDDNGNNNRDDNNDNGNNNRDDNNDNGSNNGDNGGGNRRRALRAARGAATAGRRMLESRSGGVCPKDSDVIVGTREECAAQCQERVAGKADTYEFHQVTLVGGTTMCCDCRIKRGTVEPTPPSPPLSTNADDDDTLWYPDPNVPFVTPSSQDGVNVFAECSAPESQQVTIQENLFNAANSGELCKTLDGSGVPCDSVVLFNNAVDVVIRAQVAPGGTDAAAAGTSGGGGLSTGAIVGIAVGGCAVLAAVVISISIYVSCRRKRSIDRAAQLRTDMRRFDAPPSEESKWRQAYTARMQESIRRAEEAAERQKVQGSGPSFLEVQDRALSQQGGEHATPQQAGSKRGFTRTPGSASSQPNLQRDSYNQSLMTGSELSSPPPSAASSKPSRTRSLKKLFSSKS